MLTFGVFLIAWFLFLIYSKMQGRSGQEDVANFIAELLEIVFKVIAIPFKLFAWFIKSIFKLLKALISMLIDIANGTKLFIAKELSYKGIKKNLHHFYRFVGKSFIRNKIIWSFLVLYVTSGIITLCESYNPGITGGTKEEQEAFLLIGAFLGVGFYWILLFLNKLTSFTKENLDKEIRDKNIEEVGSYLKDVPKKLFIALQAFLIWLLVLVIIGFGIGYFYGLNVYLTDAGEERISDGVLLIIILILATVIVLSFIMPVRLYRKISDRKNPNKIINENKSH